MAEITLVAEPGRPTGSSAARRLRATGRIPAVVYGHGAEALAVSVDGRELRHALSGDSGTNQLLDLRIGSQRHLALARVLQRHPVRHTVTHVDFQIVSRDEVISADVPIVLVGEATAVAAEGGMIEQPLTTLTVNATPSRIPTAIEIDISKLSVGEPIRVADLDLPSGVGTDLPGDEVVVMASVARSEAAASDAGAGEAAGGDGQGGGAGGGQAGGGEASAGGGEG